MALTACLGLAGGCTRGQVGTATDEVVYGKDGRREVFEVHEPILTTVARQSVVALIPWSALADVTTDPHLDDAVESLEDAFDLCKSQRFRKQPTAAECSGTVIDAGEWDEITGAVLRPALVVTAGHCVANQAECQSYAYAFDYFYEDEDELAVISPDAIYHCQDLVVREMDMNRDFAVLSLDRPLGIGRAAARMDRDDQARRPGDEIVVIGFPSGLPAKIDTTGEVMHAFAFDRSFFHATPDTFGGNSGSGIFDDDGLLIGVMIEGAEDYRPKDEDDDDSCQVVNELDADDANDGEVIVYPGRVLDALCPVVPSAAPCDGYRRADLTAESVGLAPGAACPVAIEIEPEDQRIEFELGPEDGNHHAGCAERPYSADPSDLLGVGPERVFTFETTTMTAFEVRTRRADTVVYLRESCELLAPTLACNDDDPEKDGETGSRLDLELAPGRYYLFVDSFARELEEEVRVDLEFDSVSQSAAAGNVD